MKNNKRIINLIILFIVIALVMYFALKDDFTGVIKQLTNINIVYLGLGLLFLAVSLIFRSLIFYRLVKRFNKDYTFANSFKLRVITQLFDAITPFASGGQPYQVYDLKKHNVSLTNGANVVVEDFIIFQIAYIILSVFVLVYNYFFHVFSTIDFLKTLVIIGFCINLFIFSTILLLSFSKNISKAIMKFGIMCLNALGIVKDKQKQYERWEISIESYNANFKLLFQNKKELINLSFMSIISVGFLYAIPFFIVLGAGYKDLSFVDSFVATTHTMIAASFVPIPGGTGGMEYAFSEIYNNFIIGPTLVAVLLTWRFITYYLGMILGSILLMFNRKKRRCYEKISNS